jgi:flavin reductase (DIM6/NTAB) family NADH-FMN oxidoreductase RutF
MSSDRHAGHQKPVTGEEFRKACGRFATGVTIASVMDAKGTPHGLTVSSFTSVSLDPPLVLICLGHAVAAIHHFRSATHFAINVLAEDQRPLSDRFARKGHDRFEGVDWTAGASGAPLIPGVLAAIECSVYRIVPMGDHDILVGEMLHAKISEGQPLLYFASGYTHL